MNAGADPGRRDEPDPDRRRRPLAAATSARSPTPTPGWCRSPRATATASASAGWPARPSGSASTPLAVGTYEELPEVAPALRRRPARADAVATLPAGARPRTCRPAGHPHGQPARRPRRPCSTRDPQRPDRARAADLDAPPRHVRARSCRAAAKLLERRRRGSRASPCTCRWPPASHLAEVERLVNDVVAAELPDPHRLGQPPHRAPSSPRSARRTPTSTVRPRIGTDLWLGDRGALRGHRDRARRPRGRARRRVRLPRPHRPQGRPHPGRLRRHRARHRPRGTDRRPLHARPAPPPWPAAASTRSASCARRSPSTASSGCSPSRPHMQASMLFLPARRRGCPRSARRSRCGCATRSPVRPRRVS